MVEIWTFPKDSAYLIISKGSDSSKKPLSLYYGAYAFALSQG